MRFRSERHGEEESSGIGMSPGLAVVWKTTKVPSHLDVLNHGCGCSSVGRALAYSARGPEFNGQCLIKLVMTVHAFKAVWEVDAGGSEGQVHPWGHKRLNREQIYVHAEKLGSDGLGIL